MTEIPQSVPLHVQLIEKVRIQGRIEISLTAEDLRTIFARQAEADESGDLPILLPGFRAEINKGIFHLHAPYTIDSDKKLLTFDGIAKNNKEGILTDDDGVVVSPDSLRERVLASFDGRLDLPHFVKLITEDALGREVTVEKLFIDNKNLGMVLEKSSKLKS